MKQKSRWWALGLIPALLALYSWGASRWIEHRYPPAGRFIEVNGLRLHYVEQGTGPGPALLLVHGASSNLREFTTSLMPALARTHRVIAFDRPGYGYSERAAGPWMNPAQLAALLLDACATLGVDKPVIVGHSWAGSVVMASLVEMPQRVSGGILLAGVAGHWAGSVGWTYDVGSLPVIGPLFTWTSVTPAGQLLLPREVAPVLSPQPVPAHYIENIGAPLALRPWTFRDNMQDMTQLNEYLQSLSPQYDRIRLPLLMIHGADDVLVPFWNHGRRVLPVVPQAKAVLLPDAGHALHHTHTREVTASIEQFINAVPSPDSPRP